MVEARQAEPSEKNVGRNRRAAGWFLLTLSLLVTAASISSVWITAYSFSRNSGGFVMIQSGQLTVEPALDAKLLKPSNWTVRAHEFSVHGELKWRVEAVPRPGVLSTDLTIAGVSRDSMGGTYLVAVLWPVASTLLASALLFFRSSTRARRRATTNACSKCGYTRAGLTPATPCPECGAATASSQTR